MQTDSDPKKENPDALAGAIGANTIVEIGCPVNSLNLPPEATAFIDAVTNLPRKDRLPVLELAVDHYRAGQPIPPLMGYMDEAAFWADCASRDELKAYAVACFNRLCPSDQAAFLGYVQGRAAA